MCLQLFWFWLPKSGRGCLGYGWGPEGILGSNVSFLKYPYTSKLMKTADFSHWNVTINHRYSHMERSQPCLTFLSLVHEWSFCEGTFQKHSDCSSFFAPCHWKGMASVNNCNSQYGLIGVWPCQGNDHLSTFHSMGTTNLLLSNVYGHL